eukprot:COSAG05_NODE_7281_length_833_cov_1.297003_1_plen_117_part_00
MSTAAWNESSAACGGGIWWSTKHSYRNAIANELFLVTAAKLGRRDWASKQWRWFNASGMINADSLINDGLSQTCQNNHGQSAAPRGRQTPGDERPMSARTYVLHYMRNIRRGALAG